MHEVGARRANVRETIATLRAEPHNAALWVKCLSAAIYEYRCAQAGASC